MLSSCKETRAACGRRRDDGQLHWWLGFGKLSPESSSGEEVFALPHSWKTEPFMAGKPWQQGCESVGVLSLQSGSRERWVLASACSLSFSKLCVCVHVCVIMYMSG